MNHIAPTPAPDAAPVLILESNAVLGAPVHDPATFEWVSGLKKRRKDGWSPDKQRAFIEALGITVTVYLPQLPRRCMDTGSSPA